MPTPISTGWKRKARTGPSLTLPWILFLVLGLPLGFMAALIPLAGAGIYIEPLRPFWQPWPPDLGKLFVGIAAFSATLAYRRGRNAGYHSGTAAATAAFRNAVEGRGPQDEGDRVPPPPTPPESSPVSPELQ